MFGIPGKQAVTMTEAAAAQIRKLMEAKGHKVELAGIFYHVGENEMSMPSYRRSAAKWFQSTVAASRRDLRMPDLQWYVSQQPPTDHERVNKFDVVADMEKLAAADPNMVHLKAFDLPPQEKRLVIDTRGIIWLGEALAKSYLQGR